MKERKRSVEFILADFFSLKNEQERVPVKKKKATSVPSRNKCGFM
ncbi:MAG: hypothetical protein WBI06_10045 [Paludibacter sp.]